MSTCFHNVFFLWDASNGNFFPESDFGKTFEELCRDHIRAFAKGAEDFAFSTKLTERVSIWQAKLAPILEDEERRAAFDIHRYSQELLEAAKQGLQGIKRKSDGSEYVSVVEELHRASSNINQCSPPAIILL